MINQNEQLRIAMICDPISDKNKAGAIISALRFGELMQDKGHKVIFIGAKMNRHNSDEFERGMRVYRFRGIPLPKSGGWSLSFPTEKEITKVFLKEKINVVHLILPMSGAIVAARVAKKLNIKIVAHSHSQPENIFMDMPRLIRPLLYKSWNKYLAWLYSKGDAIIYPSCLAKELLEYLADETKPSHVISNGVNTSKYRVVDYSGLKEKYNIPLDSILLFYVGRLFPEKSIDTLIRAIPYILKENIKIHVVIAGMGYLLTPLKQLASQLGVENYVTFISPIGDDDKILAYNAADIFVSPSLAELEGMTTLEAMSCGKPIIVPNEKMNATRYFVNGNGLMFKTKDYVDLANCVVELVNNQELRKKMGEKSLLISRDYDINESVDKLENVYFSVVNSY